MGKNKDRVRGLRTCSGNKFRYLIEAYLFAYAQDHAVEASLEATSWYALLLDGEDVLMGLMEFAESRKFKLKLTPQEIEFIEGHAGAILTEDDLGFVNYYWYDDPDECEAAWEAMLLSENRQAYDPTPIEEAEWEEVSAEEAEDDPHECGTGIVIGYPVHLIRNLPGESHAAKLN